MNERSMRRAIERKSAGEELRQSEWEAIVAAYVGSAVDDAQMSALLMACMWRGMSIDESVGLTRAMVASGETLTYGDDDVVVDKHSSGGVSDIVSLVAVPVVAAAGVKVAKLSGRALGHTGGTIDKLEAIDGMQLSLPLDRFVQQVRTTGSAMAAQSETLVPADKRLYRLRDRTATVSNIGLISASIVSKKIAAGARAFVFDVKCGSAAFMQTLDRAIELADALVAVSRAFGREARAVVSDMNEPGGRAIGTGIEVMEARDLLRCAGGDARGRDLSLHVAEAMLDVAGVPAAGHRALRHLSDGTAYESFVAMIEAQGGSRHALESMCYPQRSQRVVAKAPGFVAAIDAVTLGHAAREWSAAEPTAGIVVRVRVGMPVQTGEVLAEAYGRLADAAAIADAFSIAPEAPPSRPLIYARR